MRILVTGGAGFIGSHLVETLLADGAGVSVIDDFNDYYDPQTKRQNLARVAPDIELHRVDIRDADAVTRAVRATGPDAVVHLAARAGVRPSVADPRLYLETNVMGTFHLLEAAKAAGVGRFVFASSSSVYGACEQSPFREDMALKQTLSPYAATKLAGEQLCSNYAYLYGLKVVCLRFFTVYGARQRPDLAIHKFTDLIHRGLPIEVYGDGTARRDFTYIDDTIEGVVAALRYDGPNFDVFNLGESETNPLAEVITQIEAALGQVADVRRLAPVPGDMALTHADVSKARLALGYQPRTRIRDGIPKFVEWYLENARR